MHYKQTTEKEKMGSDKVMVHEAIKTPKVWGSEELIQNDRYCVKIMVLEPGHQVSMHWHAIKKETFLLISGELIVETISQRGEKELTLLTKPLDSFTLDRNVPHTFYCPDGQDFNTVFIEASSPDYEDDSFRIFPSRKQEKDSNNR